jgi:hypothetical protein
MKASPKVIMGGVGVAALVFIIVRCVLDALGK